MSASIAAESARRRLVCDEHCQSCGYPRAGLAELQPECPECGGDLMGNRTLWTDGQRNLIDAMWLSMIVGAGMGLSWTAILGAAAWIVNHRATWPGQLEHSIALMLMMTQGALVLGAVLRIASCRTADLRRAMIRFGLAGACCVASCTIVWSGTVELAGLMLA